MYDKDAPHVDPSVFDLGVPILGICYGLQVCLVFITPHQTHMNCIGIGLEFKRNCDPMQSSGIRFRKLKSKEAGGRKVSVWRHWGRDAGIPLNRLATHCHCPEWRYARYGCPMETSYRRCLPNFISLDTRILLHMPPSRTMINPSMEFSSILKSRILLVVKRSLVDSSWIYVGVGATGLW